MANLTSLPLQLAPKKLVCRAIIETPKGSRNKFDYDPDSDLFMLGGLLPEGMMFPFDFGFIPSTLGASIMHEVVSLVERGEARAVIGETVEFNELPESLERMARRESIGRTVVMVT